jgi:hypothetical protein
MRFRRVLGAVLMAGVLMTTAAIAQGEAFSIRVRESPTLAYPVLRSTDDKRAGADRA